MSTLSQNSVPSVRFSLKAYTVKQLAEVYGVSSKTFRRWLEPFQREIGPKQGYFYNINQVKRIVARLGVPGNVIVD